MKKSIVKVKLDAGNSPIVYERKEWNLHRLMALHRPSGCFFIVDVEPFDDDELEFGDREDLIFAELVMVNRGWAWPTPEEQIELGRMAIAICLAETKARARA